MFLEKTFLGVNLYHLLIWFLIYSILGWLVESIYMSICNRKWTNRGFSRGPICPIYGVGAITVYLLLSPYSENRILLFILGMIVATGIEMVTAMIMQRLFGEVWWDYHNKPFNYKGILCLESSLAWGLYTVILFGVLHRFVERLANAVPFQTGARFGAVIVILTALDYFVTMKQKSVDRKQSAV